MIARLLLVFLTFIAFTGTAQVAFEQQQFFKTDIKPNFMVLGDLDDDGHDDFMIASENEKFITIMLKATMYTPVDLIIGETGAAERGITFGDFDEDGNVDLAVTDLNGNRVAVLFGSGNGAFGQPMYYPVGLSPVDIQSADYDDDGDIDLVTANNASSNVSILSNNGNGTFAASVELQVQDGPKTVELNDVNGDAVIDLLVINNVSNSLWILHGDGNGGFGIPVDYALAAGPTELQIADINSDTFEDIVVVHDGLNSISILYATPNGTFNDAVTEATDHPTTGGIFTIADINEDTAPDIAICSKSSKEVILLLGDGLGNFVESVVGSIGGAGYPQLHDVIARDVSETGHFDLMLTNRGSIHIIGMVGDGTGVFNSYNEFHSSPSPYRLTVNDFNGDSHPDVAAANYFTNFISLYINDGQGGFARPVNLEAPGSTFVTSADLDDDGFLDIIAGGYLKLNIFYGDATYKYDVVEAHDFTEGGSISIADVNGDDNLDLATIHNVYLGNGNRQFTLSHSYDTPTSPSDATLCDLNADGKLDWIMVYFDNDQIKMHPGNGDGTFGAPVSITVGDGPGAITFGYFDDDADVDVAVTNGLGGTISIIPGGTGTLSATSSVSLSNFGLGKLLAVDMNDDGKGDLLVANVYTPVLLMGNGDGTFAEQQLVTSGNQQAMAAYDFDGNGALDVMSVSNMLNGGIGGITILLSDIEPQTASTNLTFTDLEGNNVTLNWDNGDGAERLVVARKTLPVGGLPIDDVNYEANEDFGEGAQLGIGNFIVYKGNGNSTNVANLAKGTTYHFAVIEFNSNSSNSIVNYNTTNFLAGEVTTPVNEPTVAASNLTFSAVSDIGWTNGDGDSRIVVAKAGSAVDVMPVDDVQYNPDATFGNGEDLGGGNFVLYDGTETTFTVLNLQPGVEYHYAVFEYSRNESGTIVNYLTSEYLSGPGPVKEEQTIAFEAIPQKQYLADIEFSLNAVASSALAVTYSSSEPLVATVEGSLVTIVGPGTTTISAQQVGNLNFLPAPAVSQDLVVIRAAQTITFGEIFDRHIGDVFDINASASSGLDVVFESDNAIASVSGVTVTLSGTGTATITATQAGSDLYLPAEPVSVTFDILKADNFISFDPIADKTLGFNPFSLEASATSGLPIVFSTASDKISVTGSSVTGIKAGRATIVATELGDDYYAAASSEEQSFCINPEQPVITVSVTSGGVTLISSNDSGNQWRLDGSDIDDATASAVTVTNEGTYTVITKVDDCVSEESSAIILAGQSITFGAIEQKQYLETTTFVLNATASSGLAVTYTSSEPLVATVEGNIVTIVGAGTTIITANQEGSEGFLPATSVTRELFVTKAPNSISFASLVNKTLGFAPFDLEATAASGLGVVFSTPSDKASISGTTVTGVKAGRLTVIANEPGNENFEAATAVEQSFCINPAKPVITVTMVEGAPILTSSNSEGNQWKLAGENIDGATTATLNPTAEGAYTVVTTVDDCVSEASEVTDLVVTGVAHREAAIRVYPNPTTDFLHVEVASDVDENVEIVIVDMIGRVMINRTGRTNHTEVIDMSGAVGGYYVVRVATTRATHVERFSKR